MYVPMLKKPPTDRTRPVFLDLIPCKEGTKLVLCVVDEQGRQIDNGAVATLRVHDGKYTMSRHKDLDPDLFWTNDEGCITYWIEES